MMVLHSGVEHVLKQQTPAFTTGNRPALTRAGTTQLEALSNSPFNQSDQNTGEQNCHAAHKAHDEIISAGLAAQQPYLCHLG
jgi:hypothetical protein